MRFWVGIDDTDSKNGMCTTYVCKMVMEKLEENGSKIIGFPRLIRLNPNVPYKTRGNGAVSFLVETEDTSALIEVTNEVILEFSELDDRDTDPGAVFINAENHELLEVLFNFSKKVIREFVSIDEAFFLIGKYMIPHLKYKTGRGLIGALAAVGAECNDQTLELLAYRKRERFGKRRIIDRDSFFLADLLTYPETFDTVDWGNDTVVSVPNSPDPVLFGIRGTTLESIFEAFKIVRTEEIDRYQVFVTNQATDMHLIHEDEVSGISEGKSYILSGVVVDEPFEIKGGHVFFSISTRFGEVVCCAFEPTKQFRNVIRKLKRGDAVTVFGSFKDGAINLEKIRLDRLADIFIEENPVCEICGKKMESEGRGKGFRCKKCKTRAEKKVRVRIERDLELGYYEVPPSARRHLSKPLVMMSDGERHIFR